MGEKEEEVLSVKQVVEELLKEDEDRKKSVTNRLRSDDNYLALRVLAKLGYAEYNVQNDTVTFDLDEVDGDMPKFATVKRVRAKFQNDLGLYQSPEQVKKNREKAEADMENINEFFDDRDREEIKEKIEG